MRPVCPPTAAFMVWALRGMVVTVIFAAEHLTGRRKGASARTIVGQMITFLRPRKNAGPRQSDTVCFLLLVVLGAQNITRQESNSSTKPTTKPGAFCPYFFAVVPLIHCYYYCCRAF
jgi:hypothetical protein